MKATNSNIIFIEKYERREIQEKWVHLHHVVQEIHLHLLNIRALPRIINKNLSDKKLKFWNFSRTGKLGSYIMSSGQRSNMKLTHNELELKWTA